LKKLFKKMVNSIDYRKVQISLLLIQMQYINTEVDINLSKVIT
jgi:hypothetical protein